MLVFNSFSQEDTICRILFRSLKFWYVGNDGECVDEQDKAAVIIDGMYVWWSIVSGQRRSQGGGEEGAAVVFFRG